MHKLKVLARWARIMVVRHVMPVVYMALAMGTVLFGLLYIGFKREGYL